jgi:hypothetical protein
MSLVVKTGWMHMGPMYLGQMYPSLPDQGTLEFPRGEFKISLLVRTPKSLHLL